MRLGTLYNAGGTLRCHTMRTIKPTTVAHHSWGVCLILLHICEPSANLLAAAIYHDLAESETGDVPATAKWASGELKSALDRMEGLFNFKYGLDVKLTVQEQELLKWADMFEFILYVKSEIELGNSTLDTLLERASAYLRGLGTPTVNSAYLIQEWL